MLGVEHHSELLCACCVSACHDGPWMRPMWNSTRMQRNRTTLDPAPGTKISAHVKENFVGLDVVVYPRNFYRLRMCIQHSRRKRAHHISANLKGLMDRGRLVNSSGDRFEILRVESERVEITIPTDRIEGMLRQCHPSESRPVLYENVDIFLLIDCNYLTRAVEIALRIRRSHFDLPLVIQITLGNPDRADRFENEIILLLNIVRHQSVGDSTRNDDVILSAIRQFAENRLHHATAAKHENDLIGTAIFVILKLVIRLCGPGAIGDYILVKQHRDASGVEIAAAQDISCLQMVMAQRTIGDFFRFPMFD